MWVFDEDIGMNQREITYVPGLYKIFDEILGESIGCRCHVDANIKVHLSPETVLRGSDVRCGMLAPIQDRSCEEFSEKWLVFVAAQSKLQSHLCSQVRDERA